MAHALRMSLVLLLASCILAVIPGEAAPTVPGGIGRIVFESTADHSAGEIYVRDFGSDSPIRLTFNTETDWLAHWSPDGSRIAFSRMIGGIDDIYLMDPNGSNEVRLTSDMGTMNLPFGWSPDGKKILFISDRAVSRDVWVMYADGSNPQQLTNTAELDVDAAWSPDGSTIAFTRTIEEDEGDIWLMNADGSNQRNLTNRPGGFDHFPTWSPDGSRIAYVSDAGGGSDIWVMGSDGSNRINLTQDPLAVYTSPAWSPDGSKIAFNSNIDGDWDIWMINPDGSGLEQLTDSPADEWSVDWESVNRIPIAEPDESAVHRGHVVEIPVLNNDTDPDGEEITVVDVTRMPELGGVSINPAGTITYSHGGAGFPVVDSFEYEIQDSRLATARAEVFITIRPWFDDVSESNTFVDDIVWLAEHDITRSCNPPHNSLFCPQARVTRGQMAAFLVRARGYSEGEGANLFVDDNGSIFEVDIDKLGTAGVTRGCNPPVNNRYCPDGHVTRGQMAAFLVRAFGLPDLGMSDLFVDDNDSIFEADIDKLGATGVSRGCNPPVNDRFCPDDYVTRQQMAAFIRRAVAWGEG